MFPQFFEVRTKPGSTAQTSLIAEIRGLEDFGVMYGDRHGGDVRWIKSANDAGMYAMTYNEPWMWRSRFGPLPQPALPPAEEILAREQRDAEVWDQNDAADYGEVSRAYSVRAFLNSIFHDEFDQPVMNGEKSVCDALTNLHYKLLKRWKWEIFTLFKTVWRKHITFFMRSEWFLRC